MGKIKKSFVVFMAILMVAFSPLQVFADSNYARQGLMNVYSGKYKTTGNEVTELSKDDLKVLGLFLSNYYVPFVTEVKFNKTEDDDITNNMNKEMVNVLTNIGAMESDLAEAISDTVTAYSIQSAAESPLYIGRVDKNNQLKGSKYEATYFDFLQLVSGDGTYAGKPLTSMAKFGFTAENQTERMGLFYMDSNYKAKLVFDFVPNVKDGGKQTASQTVFANILSGVADSANVGSSILDFEKEEMATQDSNTPTLVDVHDESDPSLNPFDSVYQRSHFDWRLYVDSFGSIILDTKVRQYIMVPGAMNPFSFEAMNESGLAGMEPGSAMPLNNLFTLAQLSNGSMTVKGAGLVGNSNVSFENTSKSDFLDGGNTTMRVFKYHPNTRFDTQKIFSHQAGHYDFLVTRAVLGHLDSLKQSKDPSINQGAVDYARKYILETVNAGTPSKMQWSDYKKRMFESGSWTDLGGLNGQHYEMLQNALLREFKFTNQAEALKYIPLKNVSAGMFSGDSQYFPSFAIGIDGVDIATINSLGAFDDLGNYSRDNLKTTDLSVLGGMSIFTNGSGGTIMGSEPLQDMFNGMGYGQLANNGEVDQMLTGGMSNASAFVGSQIFMSYLFASDPQLQTKVAFKIPVDVMPTLPDNLKLSDILGSFSALSDKQRAEMEKWGYLWLAPTNEGQDYRSEVTNQTVAGTFFKWHESLTGSSSSAVNPGQVGHQSIITFVASPRLSDTTWTRWMVDAYEGGMMYIVLFASIIFILLGILGRVDTKRIIITFLAFIVLFQTPPTIVNGVAGLSNDIGGSFYKNKFMYWTLMQSQSYNEQMLQAALAEDKNTYYQDILNVQRAKNPRFAGGAVTVKWMSPKKDNYLASIEDELNVNGIGGISSSLLKGMLSKQVSSEIFDPNSNGQYLYRSFLDIGTYARTMYGNVGTDILYTKDADGDISTSGKVNHTFADLNTALDTYEFTTEGNKAFIKSYLNNAGEDTLRDRVAKGFVNDVLKGTSSATNMKKRVKRVYGPLGSNNIAKLSKLNGDDFQYNGNFNVGLPQSSFDVNIVDLNNHNRPLKDSVSKAEYSSEELASISMFGLYTESPFYYINWGLYDNGANFNQDKDADKMRSILLSKNNGYFYNYSIGKDMDGYGELKDFMDFGSMFTTVLPILKESNKPLEEFISLHGNKTYENISINDGDAGLYPDEKSIERERYWHNNTLSKLYSTYSAWVDTMYDTKYAEPTTIVVGGVKEKISDPLNPASYVGRPMVFSESEMYYQGLEHKDLTPAEQAIIRINRNTYEDLLMLTNYVDFDDNVLVDVFAVIATFNFNKEFSDTNFLGTSYEMFPQNFELGNFSFDAYLRLILSTSAGYDQFTVPTSISTLDLMGNGAIEWALLLATDTVVVVGLSVVRYLTLIAAFLLGVVMVLLLPFRSSQGIKEIGSNFLKHFLMPMFVYLAISVVFAFLISLFISGGLTGVTGDISPVIRLGSPVITVSVILLISIVALILYGLLVFKNIIPNLVVEVKTLGSSMVDIFKNSVAHFTGGRVTLGGGTSLDTTSLELVTDEVNLDGTVTNTDGVVYDEVDPNLIYGPGINEDGDYVRDSELDIDELINSGGNKLKDAPIEDYTKPISEMVDEDRVTDDDYGLRDEKLFNIHDEDDLDEQFDDISNNTRGRDYSDEDDDFED